MPYKDSETRRAYAQAWHKANYSPKPYDATYVDLETAELEALKAQRLARKITRKILARQLGNTASTIEKWEWGIHRPTVAQHRAWIRILNGTD